MRLVFDAQFAAFEHPAQGRNEIGAQTDFVVHVLGVVDVAMLACGLGAVHRGVGVLDQVIRQLRMIGEQADADRGRNGELVAIIQPQWRIEDVDDRLRACPRFIGRGDVLDHHGELVAADAGDGPFASDRILQALRGGLEHAVADRMAERIVDVLEVVEVEEQQADLGAAGTRLHDRTGQASRQMGAVGKIGQRIEIGEEAQLMFEPAAFGDVAGHDHVAALARARIEDRRALHRAQEIDAILAPLPHLA